MHRLQRFADPVYALLRMISGSLLAFHGLQILFGLLAEGRARPGSQIWIGGLLQLAGGLAILLGFRTRLAAFLCSGMMAVAYLQFHWRFQLGAQALPAVNGGELSLLYAFLFLHLACQGGGIWALEGPDPGRP